MCLLCVEIAKDNMNIREAASAYIELEVDTDHNDELLQILKDKYGANELVDAVFEKYIEHQNK